MIYCTVNHNALYCIVHHQAPYCIVMYYGAGVGRYFGGEYRQSTDGNQLAKMTPGLNGLKRG